MPPNGINFGSGQTTFSTAAGNKTSVVTCSINDFVIVFAGCTGSITDPVISDNNGDGLGAAANWTKIVGAVKGGSVDSWVAFVRNNLIGIGASTTFTATLPTNTGGGIVAQTFLGVKQGGISQIRAFGKQDNGAAASAPTLTLNNPAFAVDLCYGFVMNGANPSGMTTPPAGGAFSAIINTGYATPTTGLGSIITSNGGFSGSTVTWGSNSATAHCSICLCLKSLPLTRPAINFQQPAFMESLRRHGRIFVPRLWLPDRPRIGRPEIALPAGVVVA